MNFERKAKRAFIRKLLQSSGATDFSVKSTWQEKYQGAVRLYRRLMTGAVIRLDSDRETRKILKLSGRQFRKQKRAT